MRGAVPALLLAWLGLSAQQAGAVTCETLAHEGNRYTVCEVKPEKDALRLYLRDAAGRPYGQFSTLESALAAEGRDLVFAMNAGMYHEDRSPVGHYVEDGVESMRVIPNPGPGNFGMLPNGVLCIGKNRAEVIETREYLASRPDCRFATQSGPMLVVDGALHPRFLRRSASRYIRNGVGTSQNGKRVVFAISDNPVTFHEFGSLFRDVLKTPDALFLDGNVSRLHAAPLGRSDLGRQMGPIVAVTDDRP